MFIHDMYFDILRMSYICICIHISTCIYKYTYLYIYVYKVIYIYTYLHIPPSHIPPCHVTHSNNSNHTYFYPQVKGLVAIEEPFETRTAIWDDHAPVNLVWRIYEWDIAYSWKSHGTYMKESWHICEGVMSHIETRPAVWGVRVPVNES